MRNKIHSFASTPQANIPRSKFDMPCNVKFTGNTGKLIPFYVCEVLPGDTFDVSTSIVCRLQTLIHPLMDNIYLDTYYFYVPNRLVWDNWKHFCGEPDRAWIPTRDWTIPTINLAVLYSNYDSSSGAGDGKDIFLADYFKDSILDYMGIGLNPGAFVLPNLTINALPIRAYNKIYDDWFRDENLIDPVNLYTGDNNISIATKLNWKDPLYGGSCYDAPKLHDYFTSALPQAQRGNPAMLTTGNVGENAIVKPSASRLFDGGVAGTHFTAMNGVSMRTMQLDTNSDIVCTTSNLATPATSASSIYFDNLYADISNLNLGISVNDLRMAFQVQKFMERLARGGSRYIEIIKSMFGVTSPDARMQRSEYLGGHRVPINIHQVVNQTESANADLGNTAAFSVTSDVHNDFIHSFVEHGFVIGICTVRYKHSYPQGVDRMWLRRTKFDYYWPVFASIGEQPIRNNEIYYVGDGGASLVFGYQEAWADYRFKPNRVMGEMRPGVPNTLASWHLADYYTTLPTLSQGWIKEDPAMVDRAIAVNSSVADQFLFDVMINNRATRPMPLYSVPGLVDHF